MRIDITLPAYGWEPRRHQRRAWSYLEHGGKHAELIWHRRAGKDDIALRHAANQAMIRPANYWHMLPLGVQVRKAIWNAVNPHTKRKRIDEAFPHVLRKTTREQEMMIEFINGSTWQALGSDNFENHIGSSPAGIVFSEWAQADPRARGFLRPILLENNGWQLYITTPRGKNHAYKTYQSALKNPYAYAELLTVEDTGVFTAEQMADELQAYIDDYGEDFGKSFFEQEYFCSFNAAILGAYYSGEIARMEREGRICRVPHNPAYPVFTAWDLGFSDDTVIWWFQVYNGRVHIIDYHSDHAQGMAHYASQLIGREVELTISTYRVVAEIGKDIPEIQHRQAYRYETHWLPHDAEQKRIESAGKSARDQLAAVVGQSAIALVPNESKQTGIQAVRAMLPHAVIDEDRCGEGLEAVRQYRREWDDEKRAFRNTPVHDWTSHPADGLRYLALAWQADRPVRKEPSRVIVPFTEKWLLANDTDDRPKDRWK